MSAVSPAAPAADAAALYERHRSSVLRFCLRRLGSREEAEDATQTTFLNAVGALRRGTVPRSESAWLLRIAANVCHHRHRTASRRRESACDPVVLEEVLPDGSERPEELIHLAGALEILPERQRRAVLLREWQGLSYAEIGEELGLSHSAVETLLFRARRSLADALERDGRRRGGLGVASLLGWLKTTAGAGLAPKVATAVVVVAGVAVVPASDVPLPPPEQRSSPVIAAAAARERAPAAELPAAPLRAEPRPAARRARHAAPPWSTTPRAVRGGRAATVEVEPPAATPQAAEEAAPPPAPPRQADEPAQPAVPTATPPAAAPAPSLPQPVADVLALVPVVPPLPELPQLPEQLPLPHLP